MVRDTVEGSPCADAVCTGSFQHTSQTRDGSAPWAPKAALAALLAMLVCLCKVLWIVFVR